MLYVRTNPLSFLIYFGFFTYNTKGNKLRTRLKNCLLDKSGKYLITRLDALLNLIILTSSCFPSKNDLLGHRRTIQTPSIGSSLDDSNGEIFSQ